MVLVFKADWTREIKAYMVDNISVAASDQIIPAFKFSSDDSLENVVSIINELCGYQGKTVDQVVFSGHTSLLRQLEKYFKEENKEIIQLWQ